MMKETDIEKYEILISQLRTFAEDIEKFAKKKPDESLNEFKISFVNEVIAKINNLIGEYKPFKDFTLFEKENIPSYSDVLIILNQYIQSMYKYKSANSVEKPTSFEWQNTEEVWDTEEK